MTTVKEGRRKRLDVIVKTEAGEDVEEMEEPKELQSRYMVARQATEEEMEQLSEEVRET